MQIYKLKDGYGNGRADDTGNGNGFGDGYGNLSGDGYGYGFWIWEIGLRTEGKRISK